MIKQAVILAGGRGRRFAPLTNIIPKPLITIHNKPFLEYILELLKKNNIEEVILLTGYPGEQIENHFKDGKQYGLTIKYHHEPIHYDSGTLLRKAYKMLNQTFLLLYCDNYWPLNLKQLMRFYKSIGAPAMVTIYNNLDNYSKNNIRVNEKGIVELFDKTTKNSTLNGVDIGFFILKKSTLQNLPEGSFLFEEVILQKLIAQKQLSGFLSGHKYYGLSNKGRIPVIKKFLEFKKVIFLDRDGVINKRPAKGDYIKNLKEFKILPGAMLGLKLLQEKGYDIFIVTNQAGIARRMMTIKDLNKIHKYLKNICKKKNILIKKIYYCPHSIKKSCMCRKPLPGMFFQAAREFHFDLTEAVLIGDDKRDIQAGLKAGCKTIQMPENGSLIKTLQKAFLFKENRAS